MVNPMDLWNERYKGKDRVVDYSGREILKSAHGNNKSKFAWNIDHIRPLSKEGSNKKCNLEICHILTNEEKGDSFPAWKTNNSTFHAKKDQEKGCYYIEVVS